MSCLPWGACLLPPVLFCYDRRGMSRGRHMQRRLGRTTAKSPPERRQWCSWRQAAAWPSAPRCSPRGRRAMQGWRGAGHTQCTIQYTTIYGKFAISPPAAFGLLRVVIDHFPPFETSAYHFEPLPFFLPNGQIFGHCWSC